jgi:hypothetical protein
MSKQVFKVGDKVRVKASVKRPYYAFGPVVTHKSIGEVKHTYADGELLIDFPDHTGWNGVGREMELVFPEETKQKEQNMKVRAYAVIQNSKVIGLKELREDARKLKAAKGGKANGVIIMELGAGKEVR